MFYLILVNIVQCHVTAIDNTQLKKSFVMLQMLLCFSLLFSRGKSKVIYSIHEMNEIWISYASLFTALCFLSVLKSNYAILQNSILSITISDNHDDLEKKENKFLRNANQKPNIIIIVADDMGWNDVSFHGSNQIPTPNIDALAYNGVILNSHYVSPLCTPSRATLMTGKYPTRLGLQHSVLLHAEPRGLPLNEKLLPEYLKEAGYVTHAVGKWHLGYYKKVYTPTYRGFDTFFGYYNGVQDYYTHSSADLSETNVLEGFDMRRNLSIAWNTLNKYSTDLFTEESVKLINYHDTKDPMFLYLAHLAPHSGNSKNLLQAPDEEIAKFGYIHNPERRTYAAMVSKLDQSVGEVVAALRNRGMLENSIILFISDNGAPTIKILSNHGSNYPLRGIKETPWEGAVRGVAAIWSPFIKKSKRVSYQLMSIADWLPTLLSAAGLNKSQLGKIDGLDLWETIAGNQISPRSEILINIDDISNYAAIRYGDFKYITGDTGINDEWLGESGKPSEESGFPPVYDPNQILQSKTGIAIAGVITAQEIIESRRSRSVDVKDDINIGFQKMMLTADQLLDLRMKSEIKCNVREEDMIKCDALLAPCLFNIVNDPCEMINLAESKPQILALLERAILKQRFNVVQPTNQKSDDLANPLLHNNTWVHWGDIDDLNKTKLLNHFQNKDSIKYPIELVATISILVGLFILGIITLFALAYGKQYKTKNRRDSKDTKNLNRVKNVNEIERYSISDNEGEKKSNSVNSNIMKDFTMK
ncbi:arylsulfatase B-like isoform X1 [Vespa crabro]|uniref:arylsulfatase B-like isoform X1 n=2 Tax=Vespa crabro TaxID=7445 RepID=UPI001F0215E4|nr:arylsulfatase B-like isoform X1 [Vespa crabro]